MRADVQDSRQVGQVAVPERELAGAGRQAGRRPSDDTTELDCKVMT